MWYYIKDSGRRYEALSDLIKELNEELDKRL